jgi:hypothetical protein
MRRKLSAYFVKHVLICWTRDVDVEDSNGSKISVFDSKATLKMSLD